jgi:hypothetical protein
VIEYTGFFMAYNAILGHIDQRFTAIDIGTDIREDLITFACYIALCALYFVVFLTIMVFMFPERTREFEFKASADFGTYIGYFTTIAAFAIPLIPLVFSKSLTLQEVRPLLAVSTYLFLVMFLTWSNRLRKIAAWFGTLLLHFISRVAIGMLYFYIIWHSPLNVYLRALPYSTDSTLRYSIIAAGIAVLYTQVYYRLIRPHIAPLSDTSSRGLSAFGIELLANFPLYLLLLGLVSTVVGLQAHNFSIAVVFASISTLTSGIMQLIISGFFGAVGATAWQRFHQRFERHPAPTERREIIVVQADEATVKRLLSGERVVDADKQD